MKLDKFYSLRTNFSIIGLTGRVGSGCSELAHRLSDPQFVSKINRDEDSQLNVTDALKYDICLKFLSSGNNWQPYTIISYKDVLIFHLIHAVNARGLSDESDTPYIDRCSSILINIICQNGPTMQGKEVMINRLDRVYDAAFLPSIVQLVKKNEALFTAESAFGCENLNSCLKESDRSESLFNFFFSENFAVFSSELFNLINHYDAVKRTRLLHDLANNLRGFGSVIELPGQHISVENIYTVAETINRIIKSWRTYNKENPGKCRIVIDALKNSLELMYFKEKYAGFYMVSTRKSDSYRKKYLTNKIAQNGVAESQVSNVVTQTIHLDDTEYRCNDFRKGKFYSPDIENCIQKSDYHIYLPDFTEGPENENYLNVNNQLVKLVALISQPGIVTPTAIERTMQIAYNAKYNSGCISRQVGAAITDEFYSVKSVGWNDVPAGQIPCNLRNINDLYNSDSLNNGKSHLYSDYERTNPHFLAKIRAEVDSSSQEGLSGRNCPFCFKSFQNAIENEKNQVHTRSLHAEENAMMQIAKYGGKALKGGNLFTTASPCELCSKKAYQIGIEKIFYIDQYPGISQEHILKGGFDPQTNPKLLMFQGAVGRAFHKLYEPFMASKDEVSIVTGIDPQPSVEEQVKSLKLAEPLQTKILAKIAGKSEPQKREYIERLIGLSLDKTEI